MIHWRHKWSDWVVTEKGAVVDPWRAVVGHYLKQERFCHSCGKVQVDLHREERCCFTTSLVAQQRATAQPKKDGVA